MASSSGAGRRPMKRGGWNPAAFCDIVKLQPSCVAQAASSPRSGPARLGQPVSAVRSCSAALRKTREKGFMENANSVLIVSVAVGGAIFVGIVLFWFIGVFFKKRVGPGISAKATAASALRINWEEKRAQPRLAVSWNATFGAPHGPERAQLKDISLGGAFVVCACPLAAFRSFPDRDRTAGPHPTCTQCRSGLDQCERPLQHDRQPRDGRSIH